MLPTCELYHYFCVIQLVFCIYFFSVGASYANNGYQFETREWVSEGGKVIVDGVSLSTGVKAFSSMLDYSPVGALYTVADLTVQTHPDYTICHGANAGDVIKNSGWTAIYYSLMDVQQELPPQPKPSQWHLQGHLSNYEDIYILFLFYKSIFR